MEKRRQREELFVPYGYLIRGYREDKARPFSKVHGNRARAMDTNYNTRNSDFLVGNILTMEVFKYYNMLPRDVVQSLSLEVVKTELGTIRPALSMGLGEKISFPT